MRIFSIDPPDDDTTLLTVRELTPVDNSGCDVKIFNLLPDLIRIVDFDASGDEENADIKLFIQGPPGPSGPAGPGARPTKTGLIAGGSFSGTPKKAAVAFVAPYSDTNYVIALSGTDGRNYTYESKTGAGFTISANANAAILGEVSWVTMTTGETA